MARKPPTHVLIHSKADRRSFFAETLGRLARQLARRAEKRIVPNQYFRPPGALVEIAFLAACTRCGECIEACPPGAIFNAASSAGLAAGTPVIDPDLQPCTVCPDMPCAVSCPTDALMVPNDLWKGYHLAALELDPERCIAFDGTECGICAKVCPVGEAALALDDGGRPVIRQEGCVGCGVCVRACVTTPSSLRLQVQER